MTESTIAKRSIVIAGHKTSVSLEDAFWTSLNDIALAQNMTISSLVADIDSRRERGNLSSTIRLFVLDHFRTPMMMAAASRENADAGYAAGGTAQEIAYNGSRTA